MVEDDSKEIEVIAGDGSELNISDVEKHIDIQSPKQKDSKKEVIIPTEKK